MHERVDKLPVTSSKLSCLMTKPTKWFVRPAKTQISLGIRPVLIRVFAACMKKHLVLSYPISAQRRLWSEWAEARLIGVFAGCTCHFVGFIIRWLIFSSPEPLDSIVSLKYGHAPSSIVRSSTIFKDLLQNHWANRSQISYGASMGQGNESLFAGLGHMTKMAATPIYGKNPLKIFSWTKGPKTLWLGMQHWGLGPIIVCSNDDPRLTLTYFTARSNLVSKALIWGKLLESHLMEETYRKWPEWQKVYVYIKILTPGGCLPLPRGYIHV